MRVVANKILKTVKLPPPNIIIPTHRSNSEDNNLVTQLLKNVCVVPEVVNARLPKVGEHIGAWLSVTFSH